MHRSSLHWAIAAPLVFSGCVTFAGLADAQVFRGGDGAVAPRRAAVVPLNEDISFISGALLKRRFQRAIDDGAEVIILDIHSPGGLTMVTFELMDMVLDAKDVETVAWIRKDAISGAAMLSLACDKIMIRPDARIGDAGEIVMGADGAFRYTEAKSRSVLAQKVRDTAAATGRPIPLAEKLVDKDLIVFSATKKDSGDEQLFSNREWDSLKPEERDSWDRGPTIREAGENMFFTVNGARAVELGFADDVVDNEEQLYEKLNVQTPVPTYERTVMDTTIWILNSNFMAFVLILVGLSALLIEFSAPGIGIGGLISLLCFSLFFWSRFLGGTSGWLEVTLFFVGLMFIGCEIFVIPGFGIPGLTGIVMVVGSLFMASRRSYAWFHLNNWMDVSYDLSTVLAAFVAFGVVLAVVAHYLGAVPGLNRLALSPPTAAVLPMGDNDGTATADAGPFWQRVQIGQTGVTDSPLRPGGRIRIGDEYLDATTQGDFIPAGEQVEVFAKRGSQLVVRAV